MVAFRDDGRFFFPPAARPLFEVGAPVTSDRSFVWSTTCGRAAAMRPGPGDHPFGGRNWRADRIRTMQSDVIRQAPWSALVVLADADVDVAPIVAGLRGQWTLVCSSPEQAVQAAPAFAPDLVFVDERIADRAALARDLTRAAAGRSLIFIALSWTDAPAGGPPTFPYRLQVPTTAGELEQLLWRIRHDPARLAAGPSGVERVG